MAKPITRTSSMPGPAQASMSKLAMLGYREGRVQYVLNYPLPDTDHVMQIRDIAGHAPANEIAHYAEVLRPFNLNRTDMTMPPVIVTADGWVVDGATRRAAAARLGWTTFPALILDDRYVNAPAAVHETLMQTGTMFNLTHGRGLTPSNIISLVERFLRDDTSPADLARKLQVSKTMITNVQNARKARERAARIGVDLTGAPAVTRTHLADLGMMLDRFTTPVYRELLILIRDYLVSTTDERVIVRQVNAAETEEEKLALIAAEKIDREQLRLGSAVKPSYAKQAKQRFGYFLKHEPGLLVEQNPENSEAYRRTIREVIARLEKLYQEQFNLEMERAAAAEANGR